MCVVMKKCVMKSHERHSERGSVNVSSPCLIALLDDGFVVLLKSCLPGLWISGGLFAAYNFYGHFFDGEIT